MDPTMDPTNTCTRHAWQEVVAPVGSKRAALEEKQEGPNKKQKALEAPQQPQQEQQQQQQKQQQKEQKQQQKEQKQQQQQQQKGKQETPSKDGSAAGEVKTNKKNVRRWPRGVEHPSAECYPRVTRSPPARPQPSRAGHALDAKEQCIAWRSGSATLSMSVSVYVGWLEGRQEAIRLTAPGCVCVCSSCLWVGREGQRLHPQRTPGTLVPVTLRRWENGFEIEELAMGQPNGKLAKAGKKCMLHGLSIGMAWLSKGWEEVHGPFMGFITVCRLYTVTKGFPDWVPATSQQACNTQAILCMKQRAQWDELNRNEPLVVLPGCRVKLKQTGIAGMLAALHPPPKLD
eukprot:1161932-Pelagomonas_calceolata.AAC.4